ncbi:DUF779 domain-containing protein [Cryptosporangium arvum]|uniref:Uncharacterized protein n=1 Tax=Cryptosporangium arvum DSM 44712 TaxID=927661 RepID=A0A010YIL1_9ACTN|nr:DUF779 domain-containing protein [Cryptosporangium arvum]EXG80095.1 hypothetical protein CryarDRAFT_1160 [Cryptosporangium arvum DSM 44712]
MLASRPYRQALAAYRGPVLPRSDAPFVTAVREEARLRLRRALLRHAGVDVLLQYAETPEAGTADDIEKALDAAHAAAPARARRRSPTDVLLGVLEPSVPVWISAPQFAAWRHTQLALDVEARGLPAPAGPSLISDEDYAEVCVPTIGLRP